MNGVNVIIKTEDEEEQFVHLIATKAYHLFLKEMIEKGNKSKRRILGQLMEEEFSDWNSRHYTNKIKDEIKNGAFGDVDRFGNCVASFNEINKFLFNK